MVSLRFSLLLSVIGQAAFALNALGQSVLAAKLSSIETVGYLATATALLTPIALVLSLSLRTLVLSGPNVEQFSSYQRARTYGVALFLVIAFGLAWYVGDSLLRDVIVCVALLKAVEMSFELFQARNLRLHRVSQVALSHVFRTTSGLLLLGVALTATGSIVFGLLASACTSLIVGLALDMGLSRHSSGLVGDRGPQGMRVGAVIRGATVVAIIPLIETLSQNMPRYFAGLMAKTSDVAIVSAIQYLTMPGITLAGAFAAVMIPRMTEIYSSGDIRRYQRYVLVNISAGAALSIVSFLVFGLKPDAIMQAVFSDEFSGHASVVRIALIGGGLWYVAALCGNALTAARKHAYNLVAVGAGCFSSIAFAAALWSLQGGAEVLSSAMLGHCGGMGVRFGFTLILLRIHIRSIGRAREAT